MFVEAECKGSKVTGLLLDARAVRRFPPDQASPIEFFPICGAGKQSGLPQTARKQATPRASSGRRQAHARQEISEPEGRCPAVIDGTSPRWMQRKV